LQGDGGTDTGGADETPAPVVAPDKVLITGSLVDAEGTGIPDATITFHSDPVTVVTDAAGIFQALLEAGSHTYEATSETAGQIAGSIVVTATGIINDAGQAIGGFTSEVGSAVGENAECIAMMLRDVIMSSGVSTATGIWEGAFGQDEVDPQGSNQTAIITGNSEMTANISIDGRLSGLWFPTVGAFNHIPYLSKVDDWVKDFQGSFGGIKRGDYYYWFTSDAFWNAPAIQYQSGTYAPIIEIIHTGKGDCAGSTVKEKIYVDYDGYTSSGARSNVLIRDFQVTTTLSSTCQTTANRTFSPSLIVYSRFNPNSTYHMFRQWTPARAIMSYVDDRLYWWQFDLPNYVIAMEGMTSTGSKISATFRGVESLDEARKIVPDATCFPGSVVGTTAEWLIPSSRHVVVATAGCKPGNTLCNGALDNIHSRVSTAENTFKTRWNSWLTTSLTSITDSTWFDRYKRWLVAMKMMADKNTGAIIASPSQEPTYYYSWPRDGIFQTAAYIMAGKRAEADKFFRFLFDVSQNWDDGWTQAQSSLDGSNLALPASPLRISIEEDQPPTVLWGLWLYKKKFSTLPPDVDVNDIKGVANYVVSRICPFSGLLWPSLGWQENPAKDIGQSLYTNSAAYGGLLAAAELVEGSDTTAATAYRSAARTIKNAVQSRLCTASKCHTRIKYEPWWIPDLGDKRKACSYCMLASAIDDENEYVMAFEWPFHIFDLGDPRVQSYYSSTEGTHDDIGDFSKDKPLWIPRYLFSYLYAKEAYNNSEVPSGTFKGGLDSDIREIESNFPALMTDTGYMMDQYVGGKEEEIYGDDYKDSKLGSAARPLGWSQAMGVLVALAQEEGKRIPMIEEPVEADCAVGSGPCCDSEGHFKSSSISCGTPATEYGCPDGTTCGMDVKSRTVTRHCSGSSTACDGALVTSAWSTTPVDYCSTSEMCVAGNPVCQPCGACVHACAIGETKCEGGRAYSCTTNASGCRVWNSGTNCGTSGYGSNYCYDSDVYHDYTTRGCSAGECTESSSPRELVTDCGALGCTSGACNSDCPLRTWPNKTLTALDVGSGISLSWSHPSTGSWVDHYDIARRTGTDVPQEWDAIYSTSDNFFLDATPLRGSRYNYIIFAYADCGTHARAGSTMATINY